jgi:diaminopimelate decarboxylase
MSLSARIVERHFAQKDGELSVGGVPVTRIAELHGTPLFVYDRGVLKKKLDLLRAALPERFELYYSIKANPNQSILRYFLSEGCGLEIASGGELYQALAAGCDADRILFAGPGKTDAELEYALSEGIGEIHLESLQEIDSLVAITRRLDRPANVAIRVNPAAEAQGGAMRMGGTASPFGFDEETLDSVVRRVLKEDSLAFSGIHMFTGTQILDHEVLLRQYRRGFEIARRAAREACKPLKTLDFGGGLGIPYFDGDEALDTRAFGEGLAQLVDEYGTCPEFDGTRFVVEPGRFLVGECGVYVTRVTSVKESRGQSFIVIDGGMNHHLAASGNLGQVIKRNFPAAILNKLGADAGHTASVVGPLCTPLDTLARNAAFPTPEAGDLFGIFQSGAYARTSSPLGFLSHTAPPEVLVHDGQIELIRRRGDYRGMLADQTPADGA